MDIVHLLPESVANQIAAGEVVQRPASVVKELIENSVDAGATKISVILKDGGRSVIQVIDNGKGMSPKDCEMAFSRHATSKIAQATDLFSISTFGFRGEALPSIASVAQVELRSRNEESEVGTLYSIAASIPQQNESVAMAVGTNIKVRDLFYNIPARRKFLKAESTELRNIVQEFIRVALAHPEIEFRLTNNDKDLYNLPATILRKRIVSIFGKQIDSKLLAVQCDTELISVRGFICTPNHSKKGHGEQFFFTNGRYMRHHVFHKAVMEAYQGLLANDSIPSYFLFFTVNPATIDVNIHPTKTEIKFQHEADCFTLIMASIREVLGKFNVTASIDFDRDGDLGYVEPTPEKVGSYQPEIRVSSGYNPFSKYGALHGSSNSNIQPAYKDFNDTPKPQSSVNGWEKLFQGLSDESDILKEQTLPFNAEPETVSPVIWAKNFNKYIIASTSSGLAIIDKRAAHIRILYDKFKTQLNSRAVNSQSIMFPEILILNPQQEIIFTELMPYLEKLGFKCVHQQNNEYRIDGIPADFKDKSAKSTIQNLIESYDENINCSTDKQKDYMALSMAQTNAIKQNDPLSDSECESLVFNLFSCEQSSISPNGKKIVTLLNDSDILSILEVYQPFN